MLATQVKPDNEILKEISGKKIFVFGCRGCKEVYFPEEEVEKFIAGIEKQLTGKITLDYLCNRYFVSEYITAFQEEIQKADAVIVFSCGVGVQVVASVLEQKPVYAGCDTVYLFGFQGLSVQELDCGECNECRMNYTGGICPVANCAKGLLNSTCGGTSKDGKCEVDPEKDCAWYLIYKRLEKLGKLDRLLKFMNPRDWSKVVK